MIIRTTGERLFGAGNALCMVLFCLTILYPFANLLAMSFSRGDSPYLSSVSLIPRPFTTKSYELVFEDGDLYWGFLNTVLRTVFGTAASVVIMLAAAYPCRRNTFHTETSTRPPSCSRSSSQAA